MWTDKYNLLVKTVQRKLAPYERPNGFLFFTGEHFNNIASY